MLSRMTSLAFIEWMDFHQLEPEGAMANDLRSAQVCAVLANIHAPKGKTYNSQDFLPTVYRPRKVETAEGLYARLLGAFPDGKTK